MDAALDIVDRSIRHIDFGSATTDVLSQVTHLRETGQKVIPVRFHAGVAWMVLGYDAVASVFNNEEELPAANFYERVTGPWWGRAVPTLRGEDHRIHRALMLTPLLPTQMRACMQNFITPVANELISGFGSEGKIEFMTAYARELPFKVITRMLRLPDEDNQMIHKLVAELFQFVWQPEVATRARDAMTEYLRPFAQQRRKNPGDDLISYLATMTVDGELLNETDLIDAIRFLYPAAGENTTNMLGLLMYWVLKDAATCERVLKNPQDRHAAVEEALRISASVSSIMRYTENPVQICGTQIPANSFILLSIGSANHDPAHFTNPDHFSLDRTNNGTHMAFGRGPHFCLGAHLARAELRVTLDLMLDRLPGLSVVNADTVSFQGAMMRAPAALPLAFTEILPATTA